MYTGDEIHEAFREAMHIEINSIQELEMSDALKDCDNDTKHTLTILTGIALAAKKICQKLDELADNH